MPAVEKDPKRQQGSSGSDEAPTAIDVGAYVLDLVRGMRMVTRTIDQQEIRFLDYLLAITESQAGRIAENSYH